MKNTHTRFSRSNRSFGVLAALAIAAGSAVSAYGVEEPAGRGDVGAPAPAAASTLAKDAAAFRQHTTTLTSPFFEGRAPGTRGNLLAAEYLEFHFKKLGLKPAFTVKGADGQDGGAESKSYLQTFPFGSNLSMKGSAVTLNLPSGKKDLRFEQDYTVLGFAGDAEATAPLVFVGYGLNMANDAYASYPAGTDLTGKIAIVMRFEPMNEQGKSKWDERGWSYNAALEPKIQQAVKRGAAGVILVSPPGADDERATRLETLENTKPNREPTKVPVVMMSVEQVDALVKAADAQGRSLLDLRKIADNVEEVAKNGSVIDLPGATVSLKTQVVNDPILTSNVGAILPGVGALADQYVVVGGHYDHVGYGYFGSRGGPEGRGKLHPGADDNSSGTSGVLIMAQKVAEAYAAMPADQPRRSVLFMGFTAEESGLNGSRYYTQNMIAPVDKHAIMLNFDMIGRYRGDQADQPPLELGGVGTAKGLLEFIQPMLDSSGLRIAPKPGGSGPSDHATFFATGIPVLFFFTGLHEEYHAPSDTADTLNAEGAARIIDLGQRVVLACATRAENFEFNAESASEQNAASGDAPARPRMRVRFGIQPGDYSGEDGVMIGAVTEGGTAAEAGVKAGDKLTKWNGKDVTTVQSWMALMGEQRPGDEVEFVVVRDGKEVTLKAKMKSARQTNQ
ncbi:MAG TPA: M28 family peptidase [Phycisphaerales bacterium]|nr:M28 family peptidase [Phycisphaerales bacterium]